MWRNFLNKYYDGSNPLSPIDQLRLYLKTEFEDRIKKMFDFREMYWETDKMPKDLIRQWCEVRVMFFFLGGLFVFGGIYMGLDRVFNVLPNYNSMGTIIEAWYPQIHVV